MTIDTVTIPGADRSNKLLPVIAGIFVACLVITNTVDSKLFHFLGLELTAGILIFPLSYVFGDVLTEVYGYAASRKVNWTGFASLILMLIVYEAARRLPGIPEWKDQPAFDAVFSRVPRITIASMFAYWAGEFVNSYVVAKVKVWMEGRMMSLRFVLSTIFGQFVDTIVFVIIAFTGVMPVDVLPGVIASSWGVKVAWEVIALPITVAFVGWLKKVEHKDVYDRNTNFNPFLLSES
jgi:hypothetical protein